MIHGKKENSNYLKLHGKEYYKKYTNDKRKSFWFNKWIKNVVFESQKSN